MTSFILLLSDPLQPPESCSDEILHWVLNNNLHILNDGSATRAGTALLTSPSVAVIGQQRPQGN